MTFVLHIGVLICLSKVQVIYLYIEHWTGRKLSIDFLYQPKIRAPLVLLLAETPHTTPILIWRAVQTSPLYLSRHTPGFILTDISSICFPQPSEVTSTTSTMWFQDSIKSTDFRRRWTDSALNVGTGKRSPVLR